MKVKAYDENNLLLPIDFRVIEEKMDATFVGEFCLRDENGQWANFPAQIYFVEKPTKKEYSNYFAIYMRNGKVYVTDGISATQGSFYGLLYKDELLYSAYRQDYKSSADGKVFIDGGRDYNRVGISDEAKPFVSNVELQIIGPDLVVLKKT